MIGSRCKSCTEVIAFLRTNTGSKMPVELSTCSAEDTEETLFDPKRHKSHFANCPGAGHHRRKYKKKADAGP